MTSYLLIETATLTVVRAVDHAQGPGVDLQEPGAGQEWREVPFPAMDYRPTADGHEKRPDGDMAVRDAHKGEAEQRRRRFIEQAVDEALAGQPAKLKRLLLKIAPPLSAADMADE